MSFMNPVYIYITNEKRACSNCGNTIDEVPFCLEYIDIIDGYKYLSSRVFPHKCKKCGEYFDYIEYVE